MPARPSLRDIEAFVALADEMHFGRTAERLQMAQPQLSAVISRLEQRVGTRLFQRRPSVRLTPAGQAFVGAARQIMNELELGMERAQRTAAGEIGSLVVGFVSSVMLTNLTVGLKSYRHRYPGVDLQLREMHSTDQMRALRNGSIDVALLRESPDESGINCHPLAKEGFVVLLPMEHELAEAASIPPAALASEQFILFRPEIAPQLLSQIHAACESGGLRLQVSQQVKEWHTIAVLVRSGFGISIAPRSVSRLNWPGLRYVPLEGTGKPATITMCWRTKPMFAPGAAFVEVMKKLDPDDGG